MARNKKRTSGEVKDLFAQKINLSRFFQNKDTLADLQIITSDIERFISGLRRNIADKGRNIADKGRIVADNTEKISELKNCTKIIQNPELKNISGEIQSYLIYANGIISGTENTFPAVSIFITQTAESATIICIVIMTYTGGKSFVIYWSFTDRAKIFDGVIERYCGVPP